jgi:hypothetical protein
MYYLEVLIGIVAQDGGSEEEGGTFIQNDYFVYRV